MNCPKTESTDCHVLHNQPIARSGLALPQAKEHGTEPSLIVTKGPATGFDLAKITGKSAASITRQAVNKMWDTEELKVHMLSPKRLKAGAFGRTDFSPTRKNQMKGMYSLLEHGCLSDNQMFFCSF